MTQAINTITILGTGTSTGVPTIGCHCAICTSTNPKNKRFRTSIYLNTAQGKKIIVDTTPDLRSQILANKIESVDAAIITHDHADHLHGIDDLRPFSFFQNKNIPIFTTKEFALSMTNRFPYIFQADKLYTSDRPALGGGVPRLSLETVTPGQMNEVLGEKFHFFYAPHGYGQTLAFRHESFGYIIDCHEIPEAIIRDFKEAKLKVLIIDCLKREAHKTHLYLDKTLNYIRQIAPEFSGLIHMAHDFDHDQLSHEMTQLFGKKVAPLFDTQTLEYPSL
ncbi:MAG: MBL fold metallo-hydrolase [Bacteriovoracaceae bacterium]